MRVPFHRSDLGQREADAVAKVILSGSPAGGGSVPALERRIARETGFTHAIAVASCTAGFQCLWAALGMTPDEYAIFPTYTFTGPPMTVLHRGAYLAFADSGADHPNLIAEEVDAVACTRARPPFAVVPTLFAGDPVEDALFDYARRKSCYLILDAAQGYGSRLTSTTGEKPFAAVISTYATKPICTGHGGFVLTECDELASELRLLRLHGIDRGTNTPLFPASARLRYDVALPGFKANMTDMAAAMGYVQASRNAEMAVRRREIAETYDAALAGRERDIRADTRHPYGNFHLYTVKIPGGARDAFVDHMAERGVETSIHFRPLHQHSFWQLTYGEDELPGFIHASEHYRMTASLPISSALLPEEVAHVVAALEAWRI